MIGIIITYLIHSTALLLIAWILDSRLRAHAFSEQVWKLAAVLGVITPVLQLVVVSVWPQWPLVRAPSRQVVQVAGTHNDQAAAEPSTRIVADSGLAPREDASGAVKVLAGNRTLHDGLTPHPRRLNLGNGQAGTGVTLAAPASPAIRRPHHSSSPSNLRRIAPLVGRLIPIGAGLSALAGVTFACLQFSRLNSYFRRAELVNSGPLRRSLDKLLRRCSITREVSLLVAENCLEPLAFGFLRWTIVLPGKCAGQLDAREIDALLAHELAHLVRRDFWWLWMGKLLCYCAPFQPLNLLARKRWQAAAEFLCDDWAVAHGASGQSLANCLVHVAEARIGKRPLSAVFASGVSDSALARRVDRLVSSPEPPARRHHYWIRTAALILGIALVGIAPNIAPHAADEFEPTTVDHATLRKSWADLDNELSCLMQRLTVVEALRREIAADGQTAAVVRRIENSAARLRHERDAVRLLIQRGRERDG